MKNKKCQYHPDIPVFSLSSSTQPWRYCSPPDTAFSPQPCPLRCPKLVRCTGKCRCLSGVYSLKVKLDFDDADVPKCNGIGEIIYVRFLDKNTSQELYQDLCDLFFFQFFIEFLYLKKMPKGS